MIFLLLFVAALNLTLFAIALRTYMEEPEKKTLQRLILSGAMYFLTLIAAAQYY
jgi:hypothetical protein